MANVYDIDYRLVAVKWVDSYGCSSSWNEIPEKLPKAHHCFSVGWLAMESDEAIVIIPHLSLENREIDAAEQGCGDMTIPKCAVCQTVDLEGVSADINGEDVSANG